MVTRSYMMKKIATLFIMSLMAGSSLKANPRQEFEAGLNTWAVRHPILNKFREQPIVWRTSRTVINKHPNASFEETLKLTIDESILHFIDTNGLYSDIVEGMDPVYREASKIILKINLLSGKSVIQLSKNIEIPHYSTISPKKFYKKIQTLNLRKL